MKRLPFSSQATGPEHGGELSTAATDVGSDTEADKAINRTREHTRVESSSYKCVHVKKKSFTVSIIKNKWTKITILETFL